jgi:hypothetical protein
MIGGAVTPIWGGVRRDSVPCDGYPPRSRGMDSRGGRRALDADCEGEVSGRAWRFASRVDLGVRDPKRVKATWGVGVP